MNEQSRERMKLTAYGDQVMSGCWDLIDDIKRVGSILKSGFEKGVVMDPSDCQIAAMGLFVLTGILHERNLPIVGDENELPK